MPALSNPLLQKWFNAFMRLSHRALTPLIQQAADIRLPLRGKCRAGQVTWAAQHRLAYQSALSENRQLPAWVDEVPNKVLHPNSHYRYLALSAFVFELRSPSPGILNRAKQPLLSVNHYSSLRGASTCVR
ncbi:hypothetical protein [Vreelandella alkaliphila]|uniref:hypothetical protein n=1 Tax=Vreelandella alkaliphila TaxID=272774 RepID=UPI003FD6DD84